MLRSIKKQLIMEKLTFSQYKMEVISTIIHNMFNDTDHYSYYSELLVNILLSNEFSKFKASATPYRTIGFVQKDQQHLDILKREFSEVVNKIEREGLN